MSKIFNTNAEISDGLLDSPLQGEPRKKSNSGLLSGWTNKSEDKYTLSSPTLLGRLLSGSRDQVETMRDRHISGANGLSITIEDNRLPPLDASIDPALQQSFEEHEDENETFESMLSAKNCAKLLLDFLKENATTIALPTVRVKLEGIITDYIVRFSITRHSKLYGVLQESSWNGYKFDQLDQQFLYAALLALFTEYTTEINKYNMSNKGNLIKSFCPTLILEELKDISTRKEGITTCKHDIEGVCMLADISGFTKMAAKLSEEGPEGLAKLHDTTTMFLGQFVELVYSYEGDVIAFAGDALVCVFDMKEEHLDAKICCLDAMRCALELKDLKFDVLTVHIALSYGPMSIGRLGGFHDEWIYLLNGPCLSELSPCIDDAASQEIVMTDYMHTTVDDLLFGTECIVVEGTTSGNIKLLRLEVNDKYKSNFNRFGLFPDTGHLINLSKKFVPKPVKDSLTVFEDIGELRRVTTMFLKLDSYSTEKHLDPISLQPFFYMAQEALHASGGFMRQFLVDDKGCVLIGMWGVPSFNNTNNGLLALKCATAISASCVALDHKCSIGITTGEVYCGTVGSVLRHDYVGIGGTVNLAARFMGKASEGILMDETTYNLLNKESRDTMVQGRSLVLKGIAHPVKSFVYKGGELKVNYVSEEAGFFAVIRNEVAETITQIIKTFCASEDLEATAALPNAMTKSMNFTFNQVLSPSRSTDNMSFEDITVCLIEGEPGMGRSNAANYFRRQSDIAKLKYISVLARHGDEMVTLGVYRKIFFELMPPEFRTAEGQEEVLHELLNRVIATDEEAANYDDIYFRLCTFLGLTEDTKASDSSSIKHQMSQAANNVDVIEEDIISFFDQIMTNLLYDTKRAIIIEDAQFVDEATWKKFEDWIDLQVTVLLFLTVHIDGLKTAKKYLSSSKLHRGAPNAPVQVGATYDVSTDVEVKKLVLYSAPYVKISTNASRCRKIVLSSLNITNIENILKVTLNSSQVDATLIKTVWDISSGNPYWITSIAEFINERGSDEFLRAIQAKDSQNPLNGLILCRLDTLNPEVFWVAKIASIIGEEFTREMLSSLLPDVPSLFAHMITLKSNGFIKSVEHDFDLYEFQNPLLRTTIYDLIPFQVTQEYHLKAAVYIEKTFAANLSMYYSRLSYHFGKIAGKRTDALKYTQRGADNAIKHSSYGDGLIYLQTAKSMSLTPIEFKAILKMVNVAMLEMSKRRNGFAASMAALAGVAKNDPEYEAYKILKEEIEAKISGHASLPRVGPAPTTATPAGGLAATLETSTATINTTHPDASVLPISTAVDPAVTPVTVPVIQRQLSNQHVLSRDDSDLQPPAPHLRQGSLWKLSYTDARMRELMGSSRRNSCCVLS